MKLLPLVFFVSLVSAHAEQVSVSRLIQQFKGEKCYVDQFGKPVGLFTRFNVRNFDWECKITAARRLGIEGRDNPEVVKVLLDALKNGPNDIDTGDGVLLYRSTIALALGKLGAKEAIPVLKEKLKVKERATLSPGASYPPNWEHPTGVGHSAVREALKLLGVKPTGKVYNVGAVLILTSDQAVYGKAMQEGIEIGLDDCNAKLEGQGDQVKVTYEDSALRPKVAHSAAVKLINQDKIIAGINSAFSEVMANGQLFEKHKIPAITLWDSSQSIEELGDYNFGIGLWTPSAAEVSASFALDTLKAKTAVVIHTQGEWSDTVAELFTVNFERAGGKVLETFPVHPDTNDFKALLTRTKHKSPDVIYAPLMEDIIPFYKQLRQLNIQSEIVTSDIIAKEHIDQIPELLEGVYQSNAPALSKQNQVVIGEKYQRKFGRKPTLPLFNAWGYDGLMLICEALASGADTSEEIKDFLYGIKEYPGLSNTITFTPEGSSQVIEEIYKITEGEFKLVIQ